MSEKRKVKKAEATSTVFAAGRVYEMNQVLLELSKYKGTKIIFDITKQLTIPIVKWIERDETDEELRVRRIEEDQLEKRDENEYIRLKEKFEPKKEKSDEK